MELQKNEDKNDNAYPRMVNPDMTILFHVKSCDKFIEMKYREKNFIEPIKVPTSLDAVLTMKKM